MRAAAFLLLCVPATAQDWAFPHKPHLERGLVCQTCHSAAEGSQQAADNLLPNGQICSACHDGQTAPAIDTAPLAQRQHETRSYRFDHEFHLKQGNIAPLIAAAIDDGSYHGKPGDTRRFLNSKNACVACHRGLTESESVKAAAHMPQMGDCIVCHSKIDNPFTCSECHVEGANLIPADHTRQFADLHSTGKVELDKLSCLPCHGRNFGCMGCH